VALGSLGDSANRNEQLGLVVVTYQANVPHACISNCNSTVANCETVKTNVQRLVGTNQGMFTNLANSHIVKKPKFWLLVK